MELLSSPYRNRQLLPSCKQGANSIEQVEVNLSDFIAALNKTFWTKKNWNEQLKRPFTKKDLDQHARQKT